MDKQKQIEEMAKVIEEAMAKARRTLGAHNNIAMFYSTMLTNAGYCKIPENAVVIEKSEYEKLRLLADECLEWRRKNCNVGELPKENAVVLTREAYNRLFTKARQSEIKTIDLESIVNARKETAAKFAERVKMAFYYEFDELIPSIMADKIDEIAKEIMGEN